MKNCTFKTHNKIYRELAVAAMEVEITIIAMMECADINEIHFEDINNDSDKIRIIVPQCLNGEETLCTHFVDTIKLVEKKGGKVLAFTTTEGQTLLTSEIIIMCFVCPKEDITNHLRCVENHCLKIKN